MQIEEDDLVNLVADLLIALELDHIAEAAAFQAPR